MAKRLELPDYLRDLEIMRSLERMQRPERLEEDADGADDVTPRS